MSFGVKSPLKFPEYTSSATPPASFLISNVSASQRVASPPLLAKLSFKYFAANVLGPPKYGAP